MSDSGKAVFLSYASQDAEAAKRICEALRAAGLEVWFDQSELRGGDAWDAMIRKRIKDCALFVPLITPTTNARAEGYFRLEWKLAVDRSHLMADDMPFLFPVVLGDVKDATARVPDKFREVQWTRLRLDETPAELAGRVARILRQEPGVGSMESGMEDKRGRTGRKEPRGWMRNISIIGGLAIGLIYAIRPLLVSEKSVAPKPAEVAPAAPMPPAPVASAPVTEARQLAYRARALIDQLDSTPDDYATAEGLVKRALELDANDGVAWAVSSLLNSLYLSRGFDRNEVRREAARSHAERAVKLAPESPDAWLALGRGAYSTDFVRSEQALRRGLELAPNDGRLLIALGGLYRRQSRTDEALVIYERAAAAPDTRALARYDQYLIHFYLGHFAEADRCIRAAFADTKTVNIVAGLALHEVTWRGRVTEALQVLAEAPVSMRGQPRVVVATVLVNLMAHRPEEVLRVLDRLPADYLNDAWYTGPKALLAGLAQSQAGRPEAARLAWEAGLVVVRRRLQDAPNDIEQHVRLGELLAWSGQTEAALHESKVVDELSRGHAGSWTDSSARIYAALGRADEAVPLLQHMLETTALGRWPLTPALLRLDPLWDKIRDDPRFQKLCEETAEKTASPPLTEGAQLATKALALITKVGFTREDLASAEDFARRATDKEPDSPAAWGVRAGVQAAWVFRNWDNGEKRRQDTQSLANRGLSLDPDEPEALLALGHTLRAQGASAQAVVLLRRASAAHPEHVRLARALGYTLNQEGKNDEAQAVLLDILKRAPRDPLLHYELALTYCSYGRGRANPENLAAAIKHLDAAIAIQPYSSALILKAMLLAGWRGDLPAMRAVLDQQDRLPLAERAEDRSVCVAMWAGLLEHRPDRVEAAATLTARNYFDDGVMPMRPKAWSLALAHRSAGKENLARSDWQSAAAVLRARLQDDPTNIAYKLELAGTLAWLDQREEAARLIGEVEPLLKEQPTVWSTRLLAFYYAALGDAARAVPYLRTRLDENVFTSRLVVPLDPSWDKLRGQPEFEALLKEPRAKQ
jgi:tetratricopeptide (TPR) repeat protein